jgi:hypothetical protein
MKKVKIKHSTKRFQKWWGIASKATMCTHAYCSQHLRKRFGYFCVFTCETVLQRKCGLLRF